jgi:hypothetical protein
MMTLMLPLVLNDLSRAGRISPSSATILDTLIRAAKLLDGVKRVLCRNWQMPFPAIPQCAALQSPFYRLPFNLASLVTM